MKAQELKSEIEGLKRKLFVITREYKKLKKDLVLIAEDKIRYETMMHDSKPELYKEKHQECERIERSMKNKLEILDMRFKTIEQLVLLCMVEGYLSNNHSMEVMSHERDA
jgi:hypothetical protein